MKSIYDIILRMQQRPAMYLGTKAISALRAYLDGYQDALRECNADLVETPPLGLLHVWIANKFNWGETSQGWNTILLEVNQGDEAKALDHFYQLLPAFMNVRPEWMGEIRLSADNTTFYEKKIRRFTYQDGKEVSCPVPDLLYVVEFSDQAGWYTYRIQQDRLLGIDWGFGPRLEALGKIELEFGKQLSILETASESIPHVFDKVSRMRQLL